MSMIANLAESILPNIIRTICAAVVSIIKRIIIDEIYDFMGSLNRYLEQFRAFRFTQVIIVSRILLFTLAGFMCGIIFGLSGHMDLIVKACLAGSFVGLCYGVIEYFKDLYNSSQPARATKRGRVKRRKKR
jgi:O-antigen/teichoic acid export membrane protein